MKQTDIKVKEVVLPPVDLQEGRRLTVAVLSMRDPKVKRAHMVQVGWSIKNPEDVKVNDELGKVIALGRAMKSPMMQLVISAERVTPTFIAGLGKLVQEEFEKRFYNYVPFSGHKSEPKVQSEQTPLVPS